MRSTLAIFGSACILFHAGNAHAADYATKGTTATTTTALKSGFGGATGGKLVVPNAPGLYPLIVASHGFSANADNQVGWAEHFASYGFVVAVPTFPGGFSPDHAKNGVIVKTIVAELDAADTAAKGKIDKTRVGLEGHSAGGLATTLAAADISPGATVLFDPVDNANLGKAAYAKLCSPVISVFANPSMCNNNTGWFDFRTTALGPTTSFRVKGSTHCDGENAPRSLCGFTCGGAADATRQKSYARYATAFFLAHLKGDSEAAATLTATALAADAALGESSVGGGPSCATPGGDAGPPPADSGTIPTDAGTTPSEDTGSAPTDASGVPGDASATPTDAAIATDPTEPTDAGGCTCSTNGRQRVSTGGALFWLGLAAAFGRRAHERRGGGARGGLQASR